MTITEWAISLGLIYAILRQIKPRKLTVIGVSWPIALVIWAAIEYLGQLPADLTDWMLTAVLAAIGLGLGVGSGVYTKVYVKKDIVMMSATTPAVVLWILGIVGRLAFGMIALFGGDNVLIKLSDALDLHSFSTWPTALISMALCEVFSRTFILLYRYWATTHKELPAVSVNQ